MLTEYANFMAVMTALGVMALSFGYYLTLPYYNRRKLLKGISFRRQWEARRDVGRGLMKWGAIVSLCLMAIISLLFLLVPDPSLEKSWEVKIPTRRIAISRVYSKVIVIDEKGVVWTFKNPKDERMYSLHTKFKFDFKFIKVQEKNIFGSVLGTDLRVEWNDDEEES